jgi:hypothetical protein
VLAVLACVQTTMKRSIVHRLLKHGRTCWVKKALKDVHEGRFAAAAEPCAHRRPRLINLSFELSSELLSLQGM